MKHLIVGDGVAGHTAAQTVREKDPDASIHVFTAEDYPFYDRIGLRDYVRQGRDIDGLILDDADWYDEHDITLHRNTRVTTIDRDANRIETTDGAYPYDRLLLAVGGHPRTIPMEDGIDKVHHLWTLADHGKPLRADLDAADTAAVIGGGLLGFDLIGSFTATDTETTYLIREDNWWPSVLDPDGAAIMHDAMRDHGVDLRLGEEATAMVETDGGVRIETNRDTHTVDVVGMAVGHVRNTDLAADAGLDTDTGIICDEYLRTNDPHIYTAGDVAEYHDPVLGERNLGGSWITAQEQGEVAGKNMTGAEEPLHFVDTYTVNHFGLNVAALGDPRTTDDRTVITAHDPDNDRHRKLVLRDGRILGAAIIGEMKWVHPLKQAILQNVDVTGHEERLAESSFNPKELL